MDNHTDENLMPRIDWRTEAPGRNAEKQFPRPAFEPEPHPSGNSAMRQAYVSPQEPRRYSVLSPNARVVGVTAGKDNSLLPNKITAWQIDARRGVSEKFFPGPRFEPQQYAAPDSYQWRLEVQRAFFVWLASEEGFEFFVTIQFGEKLSEQQVRRALSRFDALIGHHWLGPDWAGRASAERSYFVASVEQGKMNGNTHVHMLLRRPIAVRSHSIPAWKEEALPRALTNILTALCRRKGVCPHGDVRVDRVQNEEGQRRVASYILKDMAKRNSADLILSSEFHSRHSETVRSPQRGTR